MNASYRLFLVVGGLWLCSACAKESFAVEKTTALSSLDGMTCNAYLASNSLDVEHVVLSMTGTGLLSNAGFTDSLEKLVNSRSVAVVTFDKPGISAPFGKPDKAQIDTEVLRSYTQGHLIACAHEALVWSDEVFGTDTQFLLRGHSEGALISVYLYEELHDEPKLSERVSSLVLSGFPVDPFGKLLFDQLEALPEPDRSKLKGAVEDCNWEVMGRALAVSCTYLEDSAERPSGGEVLRSLDATPAQADFFIVHGTQDTNAPVSSIEKLERWNAEEGELNMHFHYYDGAHAGTAQARRETLNLLEELTKDP